MLTSQTSENQEHVSSRRPQVVIPLQKLVQLSALNRALLRTHTTCFHSVESVFSLHNSFKTRALVWENRSDVKNSEKSGICASNNNHFTKTTPEPRFYLVYFTCFGYPAANKEPLCLKFSLNCLIFSRFNDMIKVLDSYIRSIAKEKNKKQNKNLANRTEEGEINQ